MVEVDVDVIKIRACYVELAILLTTHCGSYQWLLLIAVEGTPFTLPPLDSSSERLPPLAFMNSGRGYSSHATTTGSGSGVDFEVVFQWFSLIAIEVTPSNATTTRIWIGVDLEVIFQWLSLIAIEVNPSHATTTEIWK